MAAIGKSPQEIERLRHRLAQRKSFFGGSTSSRSASAAPTWQPGSFEAPPDPAAAASKAYSSAGCSRGGAGSSKGGGSVRSTAKPSAEASSAQKARDEAAAAAAAEAERKRRLAQQMDDFDSLGSGGAKPAPSTPEQKPKAGLAKPTAAAAAAAQDRQGVKAGLGRSTAAAAAALSPNSAAGLKAALDRRKVAAERAAAEAQQRRPPAKVTTHSSRRLAPGKPPPRGSPGKSLLGTASVGVAKHRVVHQHERGKHAKKHAALRQVANAPSAAGVTNRQKADSALLAAVRNNLPKPGQLPPKSPMVADGRPSPVSRAAAASPAGRLEQLPASSNSRSTAAGAGGSTKRQPLNGFYGRDAAAPAARALAGGVGGARGFHGKKSTLDDDLEDDDFLEADAEADEAGAEEDWRAELRSITGYDPSRFQGEHFDDRRMEASYAAIQAEERRSAKLGRDEDAREEALEAARQAAKRKRKAAAKKDARLKGLQFVDSSEDDER